MLSAHLLKLTSARMLLIILKETEFCATISMLFAPLRSVLLSQKSVPIELMKRLIVEKIILKAITLEVI